MSGGIRRREFLQMAAGAAAVVAAPTILTAQKTDSPVILGSGEHRYEVLHNWPQLPDQFTWQTTHDVAFDRSGNLYVIHEGDAKKPDHPSIFVFDPEGKYIRSFGQQFQGGGHGLEVHEEGGEEFLYVTAYKHLKKFAKLTLTGEPIWERHAPMESGIYAAGEDTHPDGTWGRDRFLPTNFAFHPDERRLLRGRRLRRLRDPSLRQGRQLQVDLRQGQAATTASSICRTACGSMTGPSREPSIVVADRENDRLQWFTLDGKHLETLGGFLWPANVDTHGELMLVPDLKSRITLLDGKNNVDGPLRRRCGVARPRVQGQGPRASRGVAGRQVHPSARRGVRRRRQHLRGRMGGDGRITKLRKLS